jgi:hypothetical protein
MADVRRVAREASRASWEAHVEATLPIIALVQL